MKKAMIEINNPNLCSKLAAWWWQGNDREKGKEDRSHTNCTAPKTCQFVGKQQWEQRFGVDREGNNWSVQLDNEEKERRSGIRSMIVL